MAAVMDNLLSDTNPSTAEDTNPSMAKGDGVSTEVVPIPSGPPPLPFLGNLRDLTGPDGGLHEHITRLVSEYGGLFSLQIPSGLINLPTAKFGGTVESDIFRATQPEHGKRGASP